jgi:hypothetical protein
VAGGLLSLLALAIALACVAGSALRLRFALAPTLMVPEVLEIALSRSPDAGVIDRLAGAVAREPDAEWERALLDALRAPMPQRTALVNEQLTELDYLVRRWVRVPRVCASICTSTGFLLAATVLRTSLATPSSPMDSPSVDAAVLQAINVAAIGMAGAAFCISIQMGARRASASTSAAFDRVVERLERLARGLPPAGPARRDEGQEGTHEPRGGASDPTAA